MYSEKHYSSIDYVFSEAKNNEIKTAAQQF